MTQISPATREDGVRRARTIVVGYTDSDASRAALRWAACIASELGLEVVVVYVMSTVQDWELAAIQINTDPLRRELEDLLAGQWTAPLRSAGVEHRTRVVSGAPAQALMQVARAEEAELIVVGMGRHGTMSQLLLGSVPKNLLRDALRPVVAVPAAGDP